MKNTKLTYSEKADNIIEALSKHPEIKLNIEIWQDEDARNAGLGEIYPTTLLTKSKDFLDIALAAEDKINDYACIEIVYGPSNETIWHMDEDTVDPEIGDYEYNQFIKFIKSLNKSK